MSFPARCSRLLKLAAVVGFVLATGGMDCPKSACQQDTLETTRTIFPGASYELPKICSTCGHAAGGARWTILDPQAEPSGTVRLVLSYECSPVGITEIVRRDVSVGTLAYQTADQGVRNICGENALVGWHTKFINQSGLDLEVVLWVRCPKVNDSSAVNPVGPSRLSRLD